MMSLSATHTMDNFTSPWVELSLLCLSMFVGFVFSRRAAKRSETLSAPVPSSEAAPLKQQLLGGRIGFQREPPAVQQASILLQQGKVKCAVELLRKLPETVAGSVPESAARSILIAALRTPKQDALLLDLQPLKGKVGPEALESLITGAADKKEVADCRQLHMLSRSLEIPKSELTLEALAATYASDHTSLRALVEESEAPFRRPFAELVLQSCSATKNYELASCVLAKVSQADAAYLRGRLQIAAKPPSSASTTSAGSEAGSDSSPDSTPRSATKDDEVEQTTGPDDAGALACQYPARATFHGLLQARVEAGDKRGAWRVVADMQMDEVAPNAGTCTIFLNGELESIEEVSRVLILVETMQEPVDDVFFEALSQACIRFGRLDVLAKQMEKFQHQGLTGGLSAQTYASMIKAYGLAHDMKRVRNLWNQMVAQQMLLTSIAIGSMVEALVGNGLCTEAWRLVQDLRKQEHVQPLLDNVIYTSILKGFANTRQIQKVMAVYEEMKSLRIHPDQLAFNTILNAFALGGSMQHVSTLLEDMKAAFVEPDTATYSALVKGFCEADNLGRALKIFKDMQVQGKCSPDEAMFSSLLSGCVKESRPDEALELLHDMRAAQIVPSNFTLNMLVKLMSRCGRLEQAFTLIEDTRREYRLKVNIQVYTGLMQACFHNGQAGKALALFDQINREGEVFADAMTYTILVRGCLRLGMMDKATELVRSAHGFGMPGLSAGCLDEIVAALGSAEGEAGMALLAELRLAAQ